MAGSDRRPAFDGIDPKTLSALQKTWSAKDTAAFRKWVKQIDRAHTLTSAADGRTAGDEPCRL